MPTTKVEATKLWVVKITHLTDGVITDSGEDSIVDNLRYAKYYKNCGNAVKKATYLNKYYKKNHIEKKATILVVRISPETEIDDHFARVEKE